MSNSAKFEEETPNDIAAESSNADCEAEDEDIVLELTVEDDTDYACISSSDSDILSETEDAVMTESDQCLTECTRNVQSSWINESPSARMLSSQQVAVAQIKVFRQYLLDGDTEARILELDSSSGQRGEKSIWGKLTKKMYGEFSILLQKRMYIAWRRRKAGSVRDRVLSTLRTEGLLTFSDRIPAVLGEASVSQHVNHTAHDVVNNTDSLVSNCNGTTDAVPSVQQNFSGETRNGMLIHRNKNCIRNCYVKMNCQNLVTHYMHKNNTEYICHRQKPTVYRQKPTVSSYSLKATHPRHVPQHDSLATNKAGHHKFQSSKPPCQDASNDEKPCSSPALTQQMSDDTNDLELDDVDIQKAMDILKAHCPNVAGLEHVGLGTCIRGRSVPRFVAAGSRRFVQIVNVGDHWVCATNWFGETASDIYVYDSLFSHVTPSLVIQISSILRLDNASSSITFHIREFKQQKPGTRWCGYYAVAAAFAVCLGTDPTGTVYSVELLHEAVKQHLDAGSYGLLPAANCKLKRDVQMLMKQRLFCVCHKRAIGQMVRCERCHNQFHASCVAVFQLPLTPNGHLERGPCCAHVTDAV